MPELNELLLQAGVKAAGDTLERLNAYRELLEDWNTRMDLTSVPQGDTVARHFVDSLLPLGQEGLFPQGCRIIDVGTGAGFPGLALAIARPDCAVTLLEAQGKRCQFLRAVCEALHVDNAEVIQERAETLGRAEGRRESYDRAVARAVAPLNILCEYLLPFVKTGGLALCWKGPAAADEMEDGVFAARALGGEMGETIPMPLSGARHVLVTVRKIEKTLPQYPRKNGIPAKRPLRADRK